MLDNKDFFSGPEVFWQSTPEIEIEPGEIQFTEIFSVVHVTKVVDVGRPADAVDICVLQLKHK